MKHNRNKIFLFLALVVGLGCPSYIKVISDKTLDGNDHYILLLMWAPALAAIVTKLVFDKNIKGLGWKFGKLRYLFISYFIPLISCLIVYSIVWLTKLGGINIFALGSNTTSGFLIRFIIYATLGIVISSLTAMGEEIGWRGFLVPEFLMNFSYTKTSLLMGTVWSLYHYPLILFSDYNNDTSMIASLMFFTISVFSICFITTWLRIKSKSLWTGVILHASHNLFVQNIFDQITIDYGKTKLFTTEFGIGLAILYVLVAFYCWKQRDKIEINETTNTVV